MTPAIDPNARDVVHLSALAPPLATAVADYEERTAPGQPFVGVAIGDAIDGGLLSATSPDRSGADDLFGSALEPHLGVNVSVAG